MKARGIIRRSPAMLTAIAAALLLVGCHSSRSGLSTAYRVGPAQTVSSSTVAPTTSTESSTVALAPFAGNALLEEARSWLGVPYLFGGNDREGVDCSGLTTQVFLNALDVRLPRTSAEQRLFCPDSIGRGALEPGDLVFFDTTRERNGSVSHVGLYIGGGDMIHSSTSRGVIVTSIDSDYYSTRFMGGGRVGGVFSTPSKSVKAQTPKQKQKQTLKQTPAVDDRSLVISRLIEEKLDSIYGTH